MVQFYIPTTPITKKDHLTEPNQAKTPAQLLQEFVRGGELPDVLFNQYDENPNIDEIGYNVADKLEGIDYLRATHTRLNTNTDIESDISTANDNVELANEEIKTETPLENA